MSFEAATKSVQASGKPATVVATAPFTCSAARVAASEQAASQDVSFVAAHEAAVHASVNAVVLREATVADGRVAKSPTADASMIAKMMLSTCTSAATKSTERRHTAERDRNEENKTTHVSHEAPAEERHLHKRHATHRRS